VSELTEFDRYLSDDGPAALVIREPLMPVEGADGVLFPATFAAGDNFLGGYNIDGDPNGTNVCLIDSVGSQANRIEPLFKEEKYKHLIPQVVVKAGEKEVSILEAGHRAGDALVRCSELQKELQDAFKAVLKGNAEPLAKIAPTSLVFGVWDSRDTQVKLPRVVASTIRAFNVRKLTRSAQFNPATEFVNDKLLDEPADKATKDTYAERGFIHVPASGTHGGVIATGGVRRDATLGLAALRLLFAGKDEKKTLALRRYILGLALTAFTHNPSGYLRQGCLLVLDPSKAKEREFVEVHPIGERKPATITHEAALKYATDTAKAFGIAESKTVEFDKERAKRDVKGGTAEGDKVKGKITTVDAGTKKFTFGKGQKKVEVPTTPATKYFTGETESTFEAVVVKEAKVEVDLANGSAVKVTRK
jgi:CRISPR-associated protein Csb1